MEKFVYSNAPDQLYRVDYSGSRTRYTPLEGFKATDTLKVFDADELDDFKQAIEKHFHWRFRELDPFITLFSDREHAENWGRTEPWQKDLGSEGGWALYVIDTAELETTTSLFKLSTLVEKLNVHIPQGARQHVRGGFVCLHHIPSTAIAEKRTPRQIEDGKYSWTSLQECVAH